MKTSSIEKKHIKSIGDRNRKKFEIPDDYKKRNDFFTYDMEAAVFLLSLHDKVSVGDKGYRFFASNATTERPDLYINNKLRTKLSEKFEPTFRKYYEKIIGDFFRHCFTTGIMPCTLIYDEDENDEVPTLVDFSRGQMYSVYDPTKLRNVYLWHWTDTSINSMEDLVVTNQITYDPDVFFLIFSEPKQELEDNVMDFVKISDLFLQGKIPQYEITRLTLKSQYTGKWVNALSDYVENLREKANRARVLDAMSDQTIYVTQTIPLTSAEGMENWLNLFGPNQKFVDDIRNDVYTRDWYSTMGKKCQPKLDCAKISAIADMYGTQGLEKNSTMALVKQTNVLNNIKWPGKAQSKEQWLESIKTAQLINIGLTNAPRLIEGNSKFVMGGVSQDIKSFAKTQPPNIAGSNQEFNEYLENMYGLLGSDTMKTGANTTVGTEFYKNLGQGNIKALAAKFSRLLSDILNRTKVKESVRLNDLVIKNVKIKNGNDNIENNLIDNVNLNDEDEEDEIVVEKDKDISSKLKLVLKVAFPENPDEILKMVQAKMISPNLGSKRIKRGLDMAEGIDQEFEDGLSTVYVEDDVGGGVGNGTQKKKNTTEQPLKKKKKPNPKSEDDSEDEKEKEKEKEKKKKTTANKEKKKQGGEKKVELAHDKAIGMKNLITLKNLGYKIQEKIGSGAYGTAYTVLSPLDQKIYILKIEKIREQDEFNKESRCWKEIEFSRVVSVKYPEQFDLLVDYEFQRNCQHVQENQSDFWWFNSTYSDQAQLSTCVLFLYEKKEDTLYNKLASMSRDQIYSLIVQVSYIVQLLIENGYQHNDLHQNNIMCTTVSKNISIFEYSVPTMGYLWCAIDFGLISKNTTNSTDSRDLRRLIGGLRHFTNFFSGKMKPMGITEITEEEFTFLEEHENKPLEIVAYFQKKLPQITEGEK